ncbi:hypothetical protein KCH_10090 [Kitasatospora cheerisanensis KCTC 2395]|uniref:Uncharacterized protein n=1 Tax=Kitasatospora cheerisanensis KCTC 2395 TaxID=1348663 RepID=A0A066Z0D9_9ACTN|nr:hypothetical protein KCH_10090 [Kitasatospora cheerisanensis KCTC 2395]
MTNMFVENLFGANMFVTLEGVRKRAEESLRHDHHHPPPPRDRRRRPRRAHPRPGAARPRPRRRRLRPGGRPDVRTQGGMLDIHHDSGQLALRAAELSEEFEKLIHPGGQACGCSGPTARSTSRRRTTGPAGGPRSTAARCATCCSDRCPRALSGGGARPSRCGRSRAAGTGSSSPTAARSPPTC